MNMFKEMLLKTKYLSLLFSGILLGYGLTMQAAGQDTLVVTTTTLSNGVVNAAYSAILSAGGGTLPYTWSITNGSLPTGLTLSSSNGIISGTPIVSGTFNFTARLSDAGNPQQTVSKPLSITILDTLVVTTTTLSNGVVNAAYTATLSAGGGTLPYTWSITNGSLPTGLTLSSSNGIISGTPILSGTFNFTAQLSDAGNPQQTVSKPLNITILDTLVVTTTTLSNGVVNAAYSAILSAGGGTLPYTWSITNGSLPTGLTLSSSNGIISGTPILSGTFNFTAQLSDAGNPQQTVSKPLSITILDTLVVTTTTLSNGVVNAAYTATLSAGGGTLPYTWSITNGSLPTGLTLSSSNGIISGTPIVSGTFNFTARLSDAGNPQQTVSKPLSITILDTLVVTTTTLSNGVVNAAYSAILSAGGGTLPYTWSITNGSLPSGLTLNSSNGIISGTPSVAGTFSFTAQLSDAGNPQQTVSKPLSITILDTLVVTTTTLSNGVVSAAYSATLAAGGGTLPYTWSITNGSLPSGLTLNSSNGIISGTPIVSGTFNFTAQLSDAGNPQQTVSKPLSITILDTLVVTTTTLSNGVVSAAYTATLSAGGGTLPYTWSITNGSLPSGLMLSSSNGIISGTPILSGTFNFTAQLSDAGNPQQTVSKPLSITILDTLVVTTTTLSNGVVNAAYTATLSAGGGTLPYTWSITNGSLPSGLTLNSSNGIISGMPILSGTFNFTAQLSDAGNPQQTVSKPLSITILDTLVVTTTTLSNGVVNAAYTATLSAGGGTLPYTWSITNGSLPSGLMLSSSNGIISGMPILSGTFNFTAQVSDAGNPQQTVSKPLSITILDTLVVTTTTLSNGVVNAAYTATLSAGGGTLPYTWSITNGSLPSGLTLNSSNGIISGMPILSGTFNFTAQLSDAGNPQQTVSKPLSITILDTLVVTTTTLSNGVVSAAYTATLSAGGGTLPYTWSITNGSLPSGLMLSSSNGIISGMPILSGTFNFTAQVSDAGNPQQTVSKPLSITILDTLVVTTTTLSNGVVNAAYSATLSAGGGTLPYTWSITNGSLPSGLTLNSSNGIISGMPILSGTFNFTAQLSDAGNPQQTVSKPLSITILDTLVVTTTTLSNGVVNAAYTATLSAGGGTLPYTWSITNGSLPSGLMLSSSNGIISGMPILSGTFNFTAQVSDAGNPQQTVSKPLSITILDTLVVTTTTLSNGVVNAAYTATLSAGGGTLPYTWSITNGSLPSGLTLNSSNGIISGMPILSGTFNFTAQLSDAGNPQQTVSKPLSITILDTLVVTTTTLSNGVVNAAYSAILSAGGGTLPYTWSITNGSLPSGLMLSSSNGIISGTPSVAGTFSFTAQLSDAGNPQQTVSKPLSITILDTLVVTTTTLSNGVVSAAYSATLSAGGGTLPYTWSITNGSLPAGLTLSSSNGIITGTPIVSGTFSFTAQLSDAGNPQQTVSKPLSITILDTLVVTTTTLSNGVVNAAYTATLSAGGGTPPYTWSITNGSLPTGLTLNPDSGAITGTPIVSGTFNFTARLSDAGNPQQTVSKPLSITILDTLVVTTTTLSNGVVNAAYTATLSAGGGTLPYTWSITNGSLPPGLTLSSSNGIISGTPIVSGTFSFTAQVSDAGNPQQTVSKPLSITILDTLVVTTTTLSNGVVSAAYTATLSAGGGTLPYTWSITNGSLPSGLTLSSSNGVISGTPSVAGTFSFMAQVSDAGNPQQMVSKPLSITILDTLVVTTTTLSNGVVNAAYTATLSAGGGTLPYTWSITNGSLPSGLMLSSSNGIISGTPIVSGTFSFTAQVSDAGNPQQTVSKPLSITILDTLVVTTTTLSNGVVSAAYTATLSQAGGLCRTRGRLPMGLCRRA